MKSILFKLMGIANDKCRQRTIGEFPGEFVQLESIHLLKLQLKFQYNVALIIIINVLNKKLKGLNNPVGNICNVIHTF